MDYWSAGSRDTRYIVLILGRRIQLFDSSLRLAAVRLATNDMLLEGVLASAAKQSQALVQIASSCLLAKTTLLKACHFSFEIAPNFKTRDDDARIVEGRLPCRLT